MTKTHNLSSVYVAVVQAFGGVLPHKENVVKNSILLISAVAFASLGVQAQTVSDQDPTKHMIIDKENDQTVWWMKNDATKYGIEHFNDNKINIANSATDNLIEINNGDFGKINEISAGKAFYNMQANVVKNNRLIFKNGDANSANLYGGRDRIGESVENNKVEVFAGKVNRVYGGYTTGTGDSIKEALQKPSI